MVVTLSSFPHNHSSPLDVGSPQEKGLAFSANVTAKIPAQGETGVSQVLPAKEEKKASLWRGKSLGWMDSPCTRCQCCCYPEQGNTFNLTLYNATGADPLFHVAVRVKCLYSSRKEFLAFWIAAWLAMSLRWQ